MSAQTLSKLLPPLIVIRTNTALAVSHKFVPTSQSLEQLRSNKGQPSFRHFEIVDLDKRFEDVYYDTASAPSQQQGQQQGQQQSQNQVPKQGLLESNGIFVRRRQWTWEADKLSTFDNDHFNSTSGSGVTTSDHQQQQLPIHVECLTDKTACENLVQRVVPTAQLLHFGASKLKELTILNVHREIFRVNNRFQIHVDSLTGTNSKFRYRVGEITVSEPFISASSSRSGGGWKGSGGDKSGMAENSLILKMVDEVEGLMGEYSWAFPEGHQQDGGVHGTLQAYLEYKRSKQDLD